MDGIIEWANRTQGIAAWVAIVLGVVCWIFTYRALKARVKGLATLPSVRSAFWLTLKVAAIAGVAIFGDRWISRRAVIVQHQELAIHEQPKADPKSDDEQVAKEPPKEPDADKSIVVKDDPAVAPATHVEAAKPIIRDGKVSHRNQAPSQFIASEKYPGYVQCKKCGQVGSFQLMGGNKWQFVEIELAPAAPDFSGGIK